MEALVKEVKMGTNEDRMHENEKKVKQKNKIKIILEIQVKADETQLEERFVEEVKKKKCSKRE